MNLFNNTKVWQYIFWIFLILLAIFLILPLFQSSHYLYNLEPYPDSYLYALTARNLAEGRGLQLIYQDATLPLHVQPLYPLVLAVGYLFSGAASAFYVINILLFLGTVLLIYQLVLNKTTHKFAALTSAGLYVLHAHLTYLPTLAMTENLSIFLLVLALYLFSNKKMELKQYIFAAVVVAALVMTRYAVIFIALALAVYGVGHFLKNKNVSRQSKHLVIGVSLILFTGIWLVMLLRGRDPIRLVRGVLHNLTTSANPQYYSFAYVAPHIKTYLGSLFGAKTPFLWLLHPFTTPVLTLAATAYFGWKALKKKLGGFDWLLLGAFLSQFVLMSVFYVADLRFILYSIPLLAIIFGLTIGELWGHKKQSAALVLLVLTVLSLGLVQRSFWREIIAANVLGRSTAWQYEAVQHFDSTVPKDAALITTLSPFYVDGVRSGKYRLLPLSSEQESMKKKQYVWGDDLDYQDLEGSYRGWLEEGRELYITNSYITHNHLVVEDFEGYRDTFEFELVSEGCLGGCNVYQLKLQQNN